MNSTLENNERLVAATARLERQRKVDGSRMLEHANAWIDQVRVAIADVEAKMRSKNIPVLRGSLQDGAGVAKVNVRQLDAATLAVVIDGNSLCVLDFEEPTLEVTGNLDLDDLHVYLRIGTSNTWIHYRMSAPDGDSDDDEAGWLSDQWTLSIDSETVNELAMVAARAPGFGSLRNARERQDFVNSTCNDSGKLKGPDLWEIAKMAESCFTLGVAPALAKVLEKEGKSVAEIGRELGLSKLRTERALATKTPAHISKLL